MNVSLRSQLVAGIAAVGATAVAIVPIAQQDIVPSAQRVVASVELSGLVNPLAVALYRVSDVAFYTFDQSFFSDIPLEWPDYFYGANALYAPLNSGIIPDVVNQFSFGALSGLVNNLSGYTSAGVEAALELGAGVSDSVFNTPGAVITAVQQLAAGDPQAAIAALVTGIIDPIRYGISYVAAAAGYVVENALQNVRTVLTEFLPYLVRELVADSLVPGLQFMGTSLVDTVRTVFQDLAAGNLEDAWNDATLGLLGLDGTVGQAIGLTIGPGIGEEFEDFTRIVIPSGRAVLTSELTRLGGFKSSGEGGITNDPFAGPEAPAAAAAESAPEVEAGPSVAALATAAPADSEPVAANGPASEVEAPASEAPASEAPAADNADLGRASKAVKRVATASAAVAAAAAGASASDDAGSADRKASKRAARGGSADKSARSAR
jgi:hypothetical protein